MLLWVSETGCGAETSKASPVPRTIAENEAPYPPALAFYGDSIEGESRQVEALRLGVTRLRQVVAPWTTAAQRTEAALDKHGDALMKLAESVGRQMAKLEAHMRGPNPGVPRWLLSNRQIHTTAQGTHRRPSRFYRRSDGVCTNDTGCPRMPRATPRAGRGIPRGIARPTSGETAPR